MKRVVSGMPGGKAMKSREACCLLYVLKAEGRWEVSASGFCIHAMIQGIHSGRALTAG
jgi:hypothetical protein